MKAAQKRVENRNSQIFLGVKEKKNTPGNDKFQSRETAQWGILGEENIAIWYVIIMHNL